VSSPPRRITQAEVARIAGVSQAMVSLVLNGSDSLRVSPKTRNRIEEALRSTGYTVDIMGRRLRGKSNRILGVFSYESVFPSGVADFYRPFLLGIEEEAEAQGFDLMLFISGGRVDGRRRVYEKGENRLGIADGCILLGRHTDREELARLLDERFPFVFIGRRESSAGRVSYVGADYTTATRELYECAWAAGHFRIGLLSVSGENEATIDRRAGYLAAARVHRRQANMITEDDPRVVLAQVRARRLTALLVDSFAMAEAVRSSASAEGIRVPEDLSIAVLGDSDPTQSNAFSSEVPSEVDWTMFRIPRHEMGTRAVRMLTQLLGGVTPAEGTQLLLPCAIAEGTTVVAPPT
jgi:DNA-binding LacI/PurR family transcriptional regulator